MGFMCKFYLESSKRQCFSYLFSCFQIRIQNYKNSVSVECVNQLGRIGKEEIGRMSINYVIGKEDVGECQ